MISGCRTVLVSKVLPGGCYGFYVCIVRGVHGGVRERRWVKKRKQARPLLYLFPGQLALGLFAFVLLATAVLVALDEPEDDIVLTRFPMHAAIGSFLRGQ